DRATDDEHLLIAARRRWVLVTHNRDDFVLLHNAWRRWPVPMPHAGILAIPQAPECTSAAAAQAISDFVAPSPSWANELFRWRVRQGWDRARLGGGWIPVLP